MRPLVVKVGGSLYDWPELGPKLRAWLSAHAPPESLIVPGGGRFADRVRRTCSDDETAHWSALESMSRAAGFIRDKLGSSEWTILDAYAFCVNDDRSAGALPHSWDVTSDSVAARAAEQLGADLVLLKSAEPPPGDIAAWAAAGYVDRSFPTVAARADLSVRAINLRAS